MGGDVAGGVTTGLGTGTSAKAAPTYSAVGLKARREYPMILHILEATVCGPYSLDLTFNDGTRKRVNVLPLLDGPIFEPLRDPAYFARVVVDPVLGTVVWPNEADFAPEALYELPAEEESVVSDKSEPVTAVAT